MTYASREERFNHYRYALWAANLCSKKIVFGMITLGKKETENTIKRWLLKKNKESVISATKKGLKS